MLTRRALSSLLFLLLTLSGGYAAPSPHLRQPVRIEISICQREIAEDHAKPEPPRTSEPSTPAYRSPLLTLWLSPTLGQRPPPSAQTLI